MEYRPFIILLLMLVSLSVSCTENEDIVPSCIVVLEEQKDKEGEKEVFKDDYSFTLFANNSYTNQSAAVWREYLFLIPKYRGKIYMYNLKEKRLLCTFGMESMTELCNGYDIYHCNQTTFGTDFYENSDPFPLLYISQRARNDNRCFTEVFRILPLKKENDGDYTSMELRLVQTIYFPPMSEANSLGNVNCVIDSENRLLYTYSRNNVKTDSNYRQCKISCFNIPNAYEEVVYLEDSDIKSSFMIDISAYYMQGACIVGRYLCIARGAASVKYIDLNIVDLKTQQMKKQIDLFGNGYIYGNQKAVSSIMVI